MSFTLKGTMIRALALGGALLLGATALVGTAGAASGGYAGGCDEQTANSASRTIERLDDGSFVIVAPPGNIERSDEGGISVAVVSGIERQDDGSLLRISSANVERGDEGVFAGRPAPRGTEEAPFEGGCRPRFD